MDECWGLGIGDWGLGPIPNKAPQSSTLYLSFSYGDTIEIIISGGACIKTNNNNKIVYYKK